jgi:hypothetical protein
MSVFSESNMGVAFTELFNDAAKFMKSSVGVVADIATLPLRSTKYIYKNLVASERMDALKENRAPFPNYGAALAMSPMFLPAGFSLAFSYGVAGQKGLCGGVSVAIASQYFMNSLMLFQSSDQFKVFPSLNKNNSMLAPMLERK